MSERSQIVPAPEGEYFETSRFSGLSLLLAGGAVVGLLLCLIGAITSPLQFSFSWLFGFIYFFTLCCGCLFWTIVHHATDAEWSVVVRRQLENIALLLCALFIFAIPILLLRHHLFEWMNIPLGKNPVLDSKRQYLNWPFFAFRAFLYFVLLGGVAFFLRRFSVAQDRDGNPRCTVWMRKVAFAGLPIFGLALSFAAFDWLMGLNYHWFSTMWGPYIFAGAAGSSMSLARSCRYGVASGRLPQSGDAGALSHHGEMDAGLLRFLGLHRVQPIHAVLVRQHSGRNGVHLVRNTESWWPLSLLLVVGRFFGPFAILLLQGIKKRPHQLSIVAGWIMLMQALDMYLIVLPSLHGTGVHLSIWDFLCPIAIGCSLAFLYLRLIGKTSTFPVRDPRLIESLRLRN